MNSSRLIYICNLATLIYIGVVACTRNAPDPPAAEPSQAQKLSQQAYAFYINGEFAKAVEVWRPLANAGDSTAQEDLGEAYETGKGIAHDYAQAATWYRKAAEQGDAEAQYHLGALYANGHGVAKDVEQATSWYRRAAEQGNAEAQNGLIDLGVDIGNGLRFARGQSLENFKNQHDGIQCFESPFVGCEIMAPEGSDCPTVAPCDHAVYIFEARKLNGFTVEYPGATWRRLLAASSKQFGPSAHRASRIGSMGVEISEWELTDGNKLSFLHFSGTDFRGNAIARPFSVHYGSTDGT
jgi:hypothetical protein